MFQEITDKYGLSETDTPLNESPCTLIISKRLKIPGNIYLTNYRLIFDTEAKYHSHINKESLNIPLTFLYKLSIEGLNLKLYFKNFIFHCFQFTASSSLDKLAKLLLTLTKSPSKKSYPAYDLNEDLAFDLFQSEYSLKAQFESMGIISAKIDHVEITPENVNMALNKRPAINPINKSYELCDTYPNTIVLPISVTDSTIKEASRFRSRQRISCLSYYDSKTGAALYRTSQPLAGVKSSRSTADEKLLKEIRSHSISSNLTIFDCRPFINAFGNKLVGKGYEDNLAYSKRRLSGELESSNTNTGTGVVSLEFLDVDNIHEMRRSLDCLFDFAFSDHPMYIHDLKEGIKQWAFSSFNSLSGNKNEKSVDSYKLYTDSKWSFHLHKILKGTNKIVKSLDRGETSVVRCSDGWDRTAQMCSLVQLCMDHTSRSVEGFIKLIIKDWVCFGHKLAHRNLSNTLSNTKIDKEFSPVLFQFLDASRLILKQFPRAFEFDERFLVEIFDCVYNGHFGEFIGNNEKEFREEINKKTNSFIPHLLSKKEAWKNPWYVAGKYTRPLFINYSQKYIDVWKTLIFRYSDFSYINGNSKNYTCTTNYEFECLKRSVRTGRKEKQENTKK